MNPKDLFTLLLIAALSVITLLLVLILVALSDLHGSTECHITSMTTQVCEYQ